MKITSIKCFLKRKNYGVIMRIFQHNFKLNSLYELFFLLRSFNICVILELPFCFICSIIDRYGKRLCFRLIFIIHRMSTIIGKVVVICYLGYFGEGTGCKSCCFWDYFRYET